MSPLNSPGPNALRALVALALGAVLVGNVVTSRPDGRSERVQTTSPYVDLPRNDEAWRRLPRAIRGQGQSLPPWAQALAGGLPRTTAAMLRLDYLHRTGDFLDPQLRGRLRWAAAHAAGSAYGEACAEKDLRHAGLAEDEIETLGDNRGPDRDAVAFAHKLTRDADSVTDDEFARLVKRYGETRVVAIVLLVAHANFQDHLLHGLGLAGRRDATEPCDVTFTERRPDEPLPPRPPMPVKAAAPADFIPDWTSSDPANLDAEIARQRARPARIRLPADETRGNRWGLVCRAYQPELAAAWSACKSAFEAEADMDPVLSGSLFWLVTRTLRCFY